MKIKAAEKRTKIIKSHIIEIPVYNLFIDVVFSPEHKVMNTYENWSVSENTDGCIMDFSKDDGGIMLRFSDKRPRISTLSHEAMHISQIVMDYIGHDVTKTVTDEPQAYLQGYIVSEVLKLAKKQGIKFKME